MFLGSLQKNIEAVTRVSEGILHGDFSCVGFPGVHEPSQEKMMNCKTVLNHVSQEKRRTWLLYITFR